MNDLAGFMARYLHGIKSNYPTSYLVGLLLDSKLKIIKPSAKGSINFKPNFELK